MTEESNSLQELGPWIESKRAWSERTFGSGHRTNGVLEHIRCELAEISASPDDVTEWIDVVLLAIDGARRRGFTGQEIAQALVEKQKVNEARNWGSHHCEDRPTFHQRDSMRDVLISGILEAKAGVDVELWRDLLDDCDATETTWQTLPKEILEYLIGSLKAKS